MILVNTLLVCRTPFASTFPPLFFSFTSLYVTYLKTFPNFYQIFFHYHYFLITFLSLNAKVSRAMLFRALSLPFGNQRILFTLLLLVFLVISSFDKCQYAFPTQQHGLLVVRYESKK